MLLRNRAEQHMAFVLFMSGWSLKQVEEKIRREYRRGTRRERQCVPAPVPLEPSLVVEHLRR